MRSIFSVRAFTAILAFVVGHAAWANDNLVRYGDQITLANLELQGARVYLDTRDFGCEGEYLCVSATDETHRRDGYLTARWRIVSKNPQEYKFGDPVNYGDPFYLQNGYDDWRGGYLVARRANLEGGEGCDGNFGCIATTREPNPNFAQSSFYFSPTNMVKDHNKVHHGDRLKIRVEQTADRHAVEVRGHGCEGNKRCVSIAESSNFYTQNWEISRATVKQCVWNKAGFDVRIDWYYGSDVLVDDNQKLRLRPTGVNRNGKATLPEPAKVTGRFPLGQGRCIQGNQRLVAFLYVVDGQSAADFTKAVAVTTSVVGAGAVCVFTAGTACSIAIEFAIGGITCSVSGCIPDAESLIGIKSPSQFYYTDVGGSIWNPWLVDKGGPIKY